MNNEKTVDIASGISLAHETAHEQNATEELTNTGQTAPAHVLERSPQQPFADPHTPIQHLSRLRRLCDWFTTSTFTPAWLPERLQHPLFGYLVALGLQVVAVLFTLYLDTMLRVSSFIGPLDILAVALVALSWGVGPSVISTIFGGLLFDYAILRPQFSWGLKVPGDLYQLLLLVLTGLAISIVASQTERARRRAERLADSLAREHARLEAIIETVPDIVAIYNKHGRMIQMNEVGRQSKIFDPDMPNRSLETLFRAHETLTLDGKVIDIDELPVARALHGETVEGTEVRFSDHQGYERFLSISAAPLRNMRGQIDGVVSVTRDLSTLHQSEREAANRAMELEAIFQSLADGVFVVNTSGQIIRSNAVFQEMVGCTDEGRAAFMALSSNERNVLLHVSDEHGMPLPPDAWPETRILRGELLQGAAAVDVHIRNIAGRELQLSVGGAPFYDKDGQLIAALCICRDVTERRLLEQRTHDALDALLTMAEALVTPEDQGVLETSELSARPPDMALRMARLTSRVLSCSLAGIFLFEASSSSLVPVAMAGRSANGDEHAWTPEEALEAGPIRPDLTARLRSGESVLWRNLDEPLQPTQVEQAFTHAALFAPMHIGEQLIGALALAQANPEYIYTPEDMVLAKAVAHLLALVFERDRLLRERAQAQATELALRAANQHMEEFLGMVSHELKTPLTSIKGNTQLAIRQLRTSMQHFERIIGLYEAAEQQSRRLNRLVDDLLDVSRTRAGHLELIAGPCDLRQIVHEAIDEQQKMWPGREIFLTMDEDTPLPLEADADRIAQVISNYLTNALKYSDPTQPVSVTVQREGPSVRLAVHDQGPGLSLEQQQLIWDRFHRVPGVEVRSSSHTSQAGLGLGLYIARNIIEDQHGSVGVQSTLGSGSTFWFTLPLSYEHT